MKLLSVRCLVALLVLVHTAESQFSILPIGGDHPTTSDVASSTHVTTSGGAGPTHSSGNNPAPTSSGGGTTPLPTHQTETDPKPTSKPDNNNSTPATDDNGEPTATDDNAHHTTQEDGSKPSSEPSNGSGNGGGGGGNNTAIIAGATAGGIVAIALFAGLIACLCRRGGYTRRQRPDKNEFAAQPEDFSMDMHESTSPSGGAAPFHQARRFVPPTSGYMNLPDQQQQQQQQQYADYNNTQHQYQDQQYYDGSGQYYHAQLSQPPPATAWTNPGTKPDTVDYKPNAL